ncbi:hypothetical protein GGR42_001522 [Saonia flava]|uniref:TonB C-terminal domain-containing protein n=1 Tax=Saonia flava TaxID=523696 RepID=A0A846QVV3_9FLAO|nr:hypothetical protein [Saonia flava]NJB71060.1 hypothetical protein [Saonia flava]
MRKLWFIGFLVMLVSCDLFESRETKTQKLTSQLMSELDWNDVEKYPMFDNCNENVSKTKQRECFQDTLLAHFSSTLREFEFILESDILDTLYLDFLIDDVGKISVVDMEKNEEILSQLPEFDGIIRQSLKTLPHLEPAIKRGIPVTAKFRIPIIINTN